MEGLEARLQEEVRGNDKREPLRLPSVPTPQIVLFVNVSTAERLSLQGAKDLTVVDWLQLGTRPTAHPRGIRSSQPHLWGLDHVNALLLLIHNC
jgi:hypothetical protein